MKLLSRNEFRTKVFERDNHKCVLCGTDKLPLDAHHIIERRLFSDGGYYLENGATLCDPTCHMKAETTEVSCEALRKLCEISEVCLPEHLSVDYDYDKWGNIIVSEKERLPGELFWDEQVQKILSSFLDRFKLYVKYPRTFHLPWSFGRTKDDRVLQSLTQFKDREVIVTEKYDGENVSIYHDGYVHAKSVDYISTPDCGRIKALAKEIKTDIPYGWRVCGENLVRKHSIHYNNLPNKNGRFFFQLFGIWQSNTCLDWDETVQWAELIGLPVVPVIYQGVFDEKSLKEAVENYKKTKVDEFEGYVVRPRDSYTLKEHKTLVGKFVRANHVQTTYHWRFEKPEYNSPTPPAI